MHGELSDGRVCSCAVSRSYRILRKGRSTTSVARRVCIKPRLQDRWWSPSFVLVCPPISSAKVLYPKVRHFAYEPTERMPCFGSKEMNHICIHGTRFITFFLLGFLLGHVCESKSRVCALFLVQRLSTMISTVTLARSICPLSDSSIFGREA